MGFLEEKLNGSQIRSFVISNPFSKEEDKKTRVITIPSEDIEMIFRGMRPRSLDYYAFSDIRKILRVELKEYLKGQIVHVSKVDDLLWKEYTKDMLKKPKQRGNTYHKPDGYKKPYQVRKENKLNKRLQDVKE
jgi:hypothetical protein